MAHNNLGYALAETGEIDQAISHYRKAIELDPAYPQPHNNLGEALARKGSLSEAIKEFQASLKLNPNQADAYTNLGVANAQLGKVADAIDYFRKAVEFEPDQAHLRKNLGMALAMNRDLDEALLQFQEADKLSQGKDASVLEMLSSVYAMTGRVTEANETAKKALEIAAQQKNQQMIEHLKARIHEYESLLGKK
jgi:Flp pilus assembly protein TadD